MSGRNRNTIRFAIGSPEGSRSRTWVVFQGRDGSVYVASRRLALHLKASLHASGNWRTGLTEQGAAAYPTMRSSEGDRALSKFNRPAAISDGFTLAFTVVVPASEMRVSSVVPPDAKDVVLLPAPSEGRVAQVTIIFGPTETTTDFWPGKGRGTNLIARLELPGEIALLVHNERDETAAERAQWERLRAGFQEALEGPDAPPTSEPTEYGALVEGSMTHGGRYFVDLNIR